MIRCSVCVREHCKEPFSSWAPFETDHYCVVTEHKAAKFTIPVLQY